MNPRARHWTAFTILAASTLATGTGSVRAIASSIAGVAAGKPAG